MCNGRNNAMTDSPRRMVIYATPDLRLPSQPQGITDPWPLPNYTAWWQRHACVNNLPKVVSWKWNGRESNLRPFVSWANNLTSTPPGHAVITTPPGHIYVQYAFIGNNYRGGIIHTEKIQLNTTNTIMNNKLQEISVLCRHNMWYKLIF